MDGTSNDIVTMGETALRQISTHAVSYALALAGAVVLIAAGIMLAGLAERGVARALGKVRNADPMLVVFLSKAARYGILIFAGIIVLAQFGVQTTSIIAALGAAGLAIGLALQGTLQNIAAGIMLLVLRPFRVGDYITAGSISGTIQTMGLFTTEMKTADGLFLMAPNSSLWNTPVTNFSRNGQRRFDLTIGIGYEDDVELAQKLLAEIAAMDGRVLDEPAPMTFISSLGDSAVNVTLRYWSNTADWFQTQIDLTKGAKGAFDANGISIPFPQRDVHYVPAKPEAKPETKPKKAARQSLAKG